MTTSELMTIGEFAHRSGLTASALRFYADSGTLPPHEIQADSGYRYYSPDQIETAIRVRELRTLDMSLADVDAVLTAEPDEAVRLLDRHVSTLRDRTARAELLAASVTSSLAADHGTRIVSLSGPAFAAAVDQVVTATVRDTEFPVLRGLFLEISPEGVTLTATDRYRLSTRTFVPDAPATAEWSGVVDGDDLRRAAVDLRRAARVDVLVSDHAVVFDLGGPGTRRCRVLAEEIPDYRGMLASLWEATGRVTVDKTDLVRALERHGEERVTLRVAAGRIGVSGVGAETTWIDAFTIGDDASIDFEMTTLYPAISSAIGPEMMIDLRGPERPMTVRSANSGDLTTIAMPTPQAE